MFARICTFLLMIVFCVSCNKLSFTKNTQNILLDTVVDFSSVDVSPSFKICDSIIEKNSKTSCFRNTIHKHISKTFKTHQLKVKTPVKETINVAILINNKGVVFVHKISSSKAFKKEIPTIDSLITTSLKKLPTLFPATKRGIPVATIYNLPIKMEFKE